MIDRKPNAATLAAMQEIEDMRSGRLPKNPQSVEDFINNEKAWNYAIGIVQVDGIKPSDDFLELVEREKRGEITSEDIRRVLNKKYKVKEE